MLKTIGNVLNVKDVLNDAHNTFIKEYKDKEADTQMENMMKEKAFNWSDEEMMQMETTKGTEYGKLKKPKYKTGKKQHQYVHANSRQMLKQKNESDNSDSYDEDDDSGEEDIEIKIASNSDHKMYTTDEDVSQDKSLISAD